MYVPLSVRGDDKIENCAVEIHLRDVLIKISECFSFISNIIARLTSNKQKTFTAISNKQRSL